MAGFDVEDGSTPTTPHTVSLQLGLPTRTVASTPVVSSAFSLPPPPPLSSAPVDAFLSAGVPAPMLSGIFSRWVSRVPAVPSTHHGLFSTVAPFATTFLYPLPQPVSDIDLAVAAAHTGRLNLISPLDGECHNLCHGYAH